jgi:hypothetical protein
MVGTSPWLVAHADEQKIVDKSLRHSLVRNRSFGSVHLGGTVLQVPAEVKVCVSLPPLKDAVALYSTHLSAE